MRVIDYILCCVKNLRKALPILRQIRGGDKAGEYTHNERGGWIANRRWSGKARWKIAESQVPPQLLN